MSIFRTHNETPPVVLNLMIANAVVFLATMLFDERELYTNFALFNVDLRCIGQEDMTLFQPWQPLTYMFMHGGFSHLFFNMFALWMFGRQLEYELGSQRFFTYYMVCGVGAALLQLGVGYAEYQHALAAGGMQSAMHLLYVPTVGASGAVFGLLLDILSPVSPVKNL